MSAGTIRMPTFDRYVPGPMGRVALTAARAVAEAGRPPFNPLLMIGVGGRGKTHLLHATEAMARQIDPTRSAIYRSAREVAADGPEDHEPNLLLIDDVQDLIDTRGFQRTLADRLEGRAQQGLATVLTMDRSPGEVRGFDQRLARLLVSGLVTELDVPTSDDRLSILQSLPAERPLLPEVLEAVALQVGENVKDMLAAYHRLAALQAVSKDPIDLPQATVLLDGDELHAEVERSEGALDESVIVAGEAVRLERTSIDTTSPADEFGDFLSEVVASVADQVDRWRERVGEAILRWGGEGYRTTRLEHLLSEEFPQDPDSVLRQYQEDIRVLQELEASSVSVDPDAENHAVFRDPDDLAAARKFLGQTQLGGTTVPGPSSEYRLVDFIEGNATRAAIHAARRLLEEIPPPSPIVIIGPSGTGKTHLLHACGNALAERSGEIVALVSVNELVSAEDDRLIGLGHATALLIDDVDRLVESPARQRELLAAIDEVIRAERPLLLSSARPLDQLTDIDARILSRLGSGLVIELETPDRELRTRLLRRLLDPHESEPAVIDALAERPAPSVRALQGMVNRVLNEAQRQGGSVTAALVRQVLDAPVPSSPKSRANRSGLISPILAEARLREKVIERWPVIEERLLEDLR